MELYRFNWQAYVLGVLVVALGLTACGDDQAPAQAEALLQQIQADNYRAWQRAPGYESRMPTGAPHSDMVDIFLNPIAADAVDNGLLDGSYPVGSILAKDGYKDSGKLDIIAVMEKRADGWFWAEYHADGTSFFSGKPATCTDCHNGGQDFVLAYTVD